MAPYVVQGGGGLKLRCASGMTKPAACLNTAGTAGQLGLVLLLDPI